MNNTSAISKRLNALEAKGSDKMEITVSISTAPRGSNGPLVTATITDEQGTRAL